MHPNALQKIANNIKGSLINCQIKDSWPQFESFYDHVESLGKEVLKHKKNWIDSSDIFSIFYDFVNEVIGKIIKNDEKLNGNLWDILGEDQGIILAKNIKDYIISIPRTFDVYIPIPNISIDFSESITLPGNISLVIFKNEAQVPGGVKEGWSSLFENKLDINKIYFRQQQIGYCGTRLENLCLKKAISNFKILLQQGIAKKLFNISSDRASRISLGNVLGMYSHYEIPKIPLISIDLSDQTPKLIKAQLPLEFSKLLNNISFNWKNNILINAKEKGELKKTITSILTKAAKLIECTEEESKHVKSAIEWCFNSYIVENQTLAFLQICIGLEALLGDEGYNGSLTETLADRCSYLISNDIKDRKTIRKEFKALYNIRSKLIHGNSLELDSNQKRYLHWGRIILELAISKEINHLNL